MANLKNKHTEKPLAQLFMSDDKANWELGRQIYKGWHYSLKAICHHCREFAVLDFVDDYDLLFKRKEYGSTNFYNVSDATFLEYTFALKDSHWNRKVSLSEYTFEKDFKSSFIEEGHSFLLNVYYDFESFDIPKYKNNFQILSRQHRKSSLENVHYEAKLKLKEYLL